ncbi:MAG: glycosyltransferase family 39 protein [candidate division WOR-3 bacterium]|nr:glycosyltransferase family 39 protein [candidate division WOR-3 bacterium]MDW7987357.1 glycosyltransferase family 39 protein [candidate division WOR-3 bacterium]
MRYNRKLKKSKEFPYRSAILIFLGALITRLIFIGTMKNHAYSIVSRYTVDSFYYHEWAQEILKGNWLGNEAFFLGPFYAYFLAAVYRLLGLSVLSIQIVQAVLAATNVLLVFLIARKLVNHITGIVAALIYIFTGILLFYTGAVLYVEVNIFFSLLLVYLLIKLTENYKLIFLILSGVVCGFLIIVRPEFIILLPLLVVYFVKYIEGKPIAKYLLFALCAVITFGLVPLHNYIATGEFVPFTTHSGINFYYGNNPQTDGTWRPLQEFQHISDISITKFKYLAQHVNGKVLSPSEMSRYWFYKGIEFIKQRPFSYLKLLLRKLLLFINNYEIPNNYYFYETRDDSLVLKIAFINYGMVFSTSLIAILFLIKGRKKNYLLFIFIAIYLISSLVFYVLSRLRAGVIPFFIIFTAVFIVEVIKLLQNRNFKKAILLIILAGVLYTITQIKLVNQNEFRVQGYIQKGNIYQTAKKFPEAVAAYKKALEVAPDNIVAHYSLLQCYISLNRAHDAYNEVQQIIYLANQNPPFKYYQELAKARYNIAMRNFNDAALNLENAAQLAPYDAETHYLLGAVYLTLGKNNLALKAFEKTLELDPFHKEAARAKTLLKSVQLK